MKLPYSEGTWFAVPLRNGGFGVGVVARATRRGGIVLAYLFGPRHETVPPIGELTELVPSSAEKVARVGDLGLMDGTWPIIGRLPEWQRDAWTMPKFIRTDDIRRRAWIVQYADDDPTQIVSTEPTSFGTTGIDREGLLGAGAAEIALTRRLASS